MDKEFLEKQLRGFLSQDKKLKSLPRKRKVLVCALFYIADGFESGKQYTESELNNFIRHCCDFEDPVTIRREFVDYKFLERDAYGKYYTVCEKQPVFEELFEQA